MTFGAFVFATTLPIVAYEEMTKIETFQPKLTNDYDHYDRDEWSRRICLEFSSFFFVSNMRNVSCIKWNWMQVCSFVTRERIMESFVFCDFISIEMDEMMNSIA